MYRSTIVIRIAILYRKPTVIVVMKWQISSFMFLKYFYVNFMFENRSKLYCSEKHRLFIEKLEWEEEKRRESLKKFSPDFVKS